MFGSGAPLDWGFDPLEALSRWPADRPVVLLHSGRFDGRWARWSVLAEPAGVFRFVGENRADQTEEATRSTHGWTDNPHPNPLPEGEGAEPSEPPRSQWLGPGACPVDAFTNQPFDDVRRLLDAGDGVFIGSLSYDLGRWIESLPTHAADDRRWPLVELAHCPGYLVYDGLTRTWHACGSWRQRYTGPDLSRAAPQPTAPSDKPPFAAGPARSVVGRHDYERAVADVINYIGRGDVFQVNLTQRFTADFAGRPPTASRALFQRLADVSPAWYGAYLEWPSFGETDGFRAIASTSPELFLEVETVGGQQRVVTRPIKGTRPASADPDELLHSTKDTAELTMIVDLMRNDIGRVCDYGSVRVTSPRTIESHPTVHHGVATIEGTLHASKGVVDLLRATLPGGSVTGAPKVRAMQIIDELEPVRRGPYCGAIGLLSRDAARLNVAIRTMMIEQPRPGSDPTAPGRVDFSVGGGVVADSTPAAEYDESIDKAAAMLRALGVTIDTADPAPAQSPARRGPLQRAAAP